MSEIRTETRRARRRDSPVAWALLYRAHAEISFGYRVGTKSVPTLLGFGYYLAQQVCSLLPQAGEGPGMRAFALRQALSMCNVPHPSPQPLSRLRGERSEGGGEAGFYAVLYIDLS